jgi:anti-sigma factor RsiW
MTGSALLRMFRPRAVVCRDAVELVTAYLEDSLGARQRAALEKHLEDCPHCTEYFAQIKRCIDAAGQVEAEDLAPAARQDLMALYDRWRADPESDQTASDGSTG